MAVESLLRVFRGKRRPWILGAGAGAAAAVAVVVACSHQDTVSLELAGQPPIPDRPDYNWDVRPILSQNCFACHGNHAQEAGLRLDIAKAAYAPIPEDKANRAIVRGNPAASEMIRRITAEDPDERMPPKSTHKVLTPREIAILTRWIDQGARYQPHWAYTRPRSVKPKGSPWNERAVNPIDRHVFARLDKAGLAPSPEADRETLINRVSLDLTGLPPTLAEVDAFVADRREGAYERLVDRLLASRAYAERQANVWMDVARYADSDGFLFDNVGRFQHPYRDWVISAFQRNMPYDRFVTWQIAGDKLPNPTREQILATAFGRMGKRSNEGGIIDEEYRVEYGLERTELMGKAFMGLTVGCAKCHDHKYDVISQRDFYSLYGFFNSMDERGIAQSAGYVTPMGPTLAWPTPKQSADVAAAHKVVEAKQAAYAAALAAASKAVAGRAEAILAPAARAGLLQANASKGLQAWYPLDSTYKASLEPLMRAGDGTPLTVVARRAAPAGGIVRASAAAPDPDLPRLAYADIERAQVLKSAAAAARNGPRSPPKPVLPESTSAETLAWTPSGIAGGAPAALDKVVLVKGAKGQAALLDDSVGMADPGVGFFERTDPFTLDVWVKLRAGKAYDETNLVYNRYQVAGREGPGYELQLRKNRLWFSLVHSQPFNALAVLSKAELPKNRWVHVVATYDGAGRAAGARLYVDGRPVETETASDNLTRSSLPQWGKGPFDSAYGFAWGKSFSKEEFRGGAIDEIKVFTRALTALEVAHGHDPALALAIKPEAARPQLVALLAASDPRVIRAAAELKAAREAEQAVESRIQYLPVMADALMPRKTYLLANGLYNVPREEVQPQALERVFRWKSSLPRNRLGLAQWMFDKDNPLTARVYVNRLWQGHFGLGLVETVEDFGSQGSNPSHPELLDWLAVEFVRSGWDIRHMHRLMVTSAVYRQSSDVAPQLAGKDPRNVLLSRGPRYRLPAETIRDNALFASGLLLDRPGGDSVFPYQPAGVWDSIGVPAMPYPEHVPADQMHRRSMYTFIRRNAAYPSQVVFDMPDRNVSSVARRISNTPLQALVLLNDPQYVEAYRKLAERTIRTAASPDEQLVMVFRLGARRRPAPGELAALRRYREAEEARLAASPQAAGKLLKVGVAPADPAIAPAKLAAMTMVVAGVMNTPDAYSLR